MMNLKSFATAVAIAACASFGALAAHAGTPALSYSANTGDSLGNPPFTLGWAFSVNSAVKVDSLGFFDDSLDGLADSHQIGLWDSAGDLLASATVDAGTTDTLIDNFRYVSIAPVGLATGDYFIGALVLDGSDPVVFPGDGGVTTTDAAVTYEGATFAGGGTLADPTIVIPMNQPGYFGPNFTLISTVPEPASWAVMLGGFGAIGASMRRRRQRAAATA